MKNNPFHFRKPRYKKRKEPRRVVGREILHGEAKTERRCELFQRSGGFCEAKVPWQGFSHILMRCNAPITWETMHWSHDRHAANKDDSLAAGLATCESCHLVGKHNPKSCRRRPGKVMKITDARVYWEGNTCFCDSDKKPKESFCGTCRPKVNPQTMYTLENSDDPDAYREALASAENEILMWRPETE